MKVCSKCANDKDFSEFYIRTRKDRKAHYSARCKACINVQQLDRYHGLSPEKKKQRQAVSLKTLGPNYHKIYDLKKLGLTLNDFQNMYEAQERKCFICKRDIVGKDIKVDHDHRTGKARKLLCHNCNTALGLLSDNPSLLRECASYLELHATL